MDNDVWIRIRISALGYTVGDPRVGHWAYVCSGTLLAFSVFLALPTVLRGRDQPVAGFGFSIFAIILGDLSASILATVSLLGTTAPISLPPMMAFLILYIPGATITTWLSGTILLTATATAGMTMLYLYDEFPMPRPRWLAFFATALSCAALTFPLDRLLYPERISYSKFGLSGLLDILSSLLPAVWALSVARMLHELNTDSVEIDELTGSAPAPSFEIDRPSRRIGILALVTLWFGTRSSWSVFPVAFLLGWWLIASWLVRPTGDWPHIRRIVHTLRQNRTSIIQSLIDYKACALAQTAILRRNQEKLIGGDIDFGTYSNSLVESTKAIDSICPGRHSGDPSTRAYVLGLGPWNSPAKNAVHGLRWGLIFAMPWIVASVLNLLQKEVMFVTYPILQLVGDLFAVVARWASFGFFFGYFFHYLRGSSGATKGFCAFVVVAAAELPSALILIDTQDQFRALLLWYLQIFIEFMLLGLVAFDYVNLRKAGFRGVKTLFEVHNVPALGAYISSIVVAIGAAVVTLMEGNAKQLVSLALEFVIPQAAQSSRLNGGP